MASRLTLLLLGLALGACGSPAPDDSGEVPVRVDLVALDSRNIPVVVLEETGGTRKLPIWIGYAEARSIATEMEEQEAPRPNTHDLAGRLIRGLDGEVLRVVVTELRAGTYYALITLRAGNGTTDIDSRPSDAIAIALRLGAPIFVRAPLFESASEVEELEEPRRPVAEPEPEEPIGSPPATRLRGA